MILGMYLGGWLCGRYKVGEVGGRGKLSMMCWSVGGWSKNESD